MVIPSFSEKWVRWQQEKREGGSIIEPSAPAQAQAPAPAPAPALLELYSPKCFVIEKLWKFSLVLAVNFYRGKRKAKGRWQAEKYLKVSYHTAKQTLKTKHIVSEHF